MNSRTLSIAVIALSGMALNVCAQTPKVSRDGRSGDLGNVTRRASSNSAIRLLRKSVESVDWLDTPFEEVISWLKDESEGRVNIVPRWGQLSVESVDRDTLVSLQLNNGTVAEVLIETLEHIAPGGELRFRAVGNNLKISTRTDFDRKMYVRVYDVTDILAKVPDFGQTAVNVDLQQQTGGGQGGGGGQSVFQGGSSGGQEVTGDQAEQELEERLEELRDMLLVLIEPASWATATTGGQGTIQVFNRMLIVRNTIEVHEAIGGYFSLGG